MSKPDFSDKRRSDVDMTPMVDVTFLLLIFFMVTASFTMQKSIAVPKPKNDDPSERLNLEQDQDVETVTILIDADNAYRVVTSDDEFECPSSQEMVVRLRAAMSSDPSPQRLIVRVHGDSTHDRTILALDAGADVGLEDVQLVTVDE
jgi:biopolymer transport protein ExbD